MIDFTSRPRLSLGGNFNGIWNWLKRPVTLELRTLIDPAIKDVFFSFS